MAMNNKIAKFWIKQRDSQRKWFQDHGGCLSAYVERYGSADNPDYYGNGGEAIYKADKDALDDAEKKGLEAQHVLGLLV
jgi:hypothetical protein